MSSSLVIIVAAVFGDDASSAAADNVGMCDTIATFLIKFLAAVDCDEGGRDVSRSV